MTLKNKKSDPYLSAVWKVIGDKKISSIRYTDDGEMDFFGWFNKDKGLVIHLEDDTQIYVLKDDEANGPGRIVIKDKDGNF